MLTQEWLSLGFFCEVSLYKPSLHSIKKKAFCILKNLKRDEKKHSTTSLYFSLKTKTYPELKKRALFSFLIILVCLQTHRIKKRFQNLFSCNFLVFKNTVKPFEEEEDQYSDWFNISNGEIPLWGAHQYCRHPASFLLLFLLILFLFLFLFLFDLYFHFI